jgi:transcriptional regulator with XRE-family HTH domain
VTRDQPLAPPRSLAHAEQRLITGLFMDRVDELRTERYITIEHLACWSGISKNTIHKTRRTLNDPRLYNVLRLRDALEVTFDELLGGLPTPVAPRDSPGPWLTQARSGW